MPSIGLNDEVLDVRAAAMSVLARAAHYDVLHVMPVVRLMTKRLMRQLQNTNDIGNHPSRHVLSCRKNSIPCFHLHCL